MIAKQGRAVCRAHQQVLQHHVVGQKDVRRALTHRGTRGLIRRAVISLDPDMGMPPTHEGTARYALLDHWRARSSGRPAAP